MFVQRYPTESERAITMDDIRKLKYMECVVKEALRLFPSVPMFAREISEECNIGKTFQTIMSPISSAVT